MSTPHELFEEKLRQIEQEKQEITRDKQELERLTIKYNLVVIAQPSVDSPISQKTPRSILNQAAREADAIVRATGHPMSINDLFRIITLERGIELASTNSLSTALLSSRRLRYIKDVGWWVPNVPWPPSKADIERLQSEPLRKPMPARAANKGGKGGPRRSPEKQLLFDTVKGILKGRTEPMKFGELFERVKEKGAPIGGQNERQNFSVFISKFSCFQSIGRGEGWRYLPERDFDELQEQAGALVGETS